MNALDMVRWGAVGKKSQMTVLPQERKPLKMILNNIRGTLEPSEKWCYGMAFKFKCFGKKKRQDILQNTVWWKSVMGIIRCNLLW